MRSLLFSAIALVTALPALGLATEDFRRLSKAESEQLNEICGKVPIYGHPRGPVQRIAYGTPALQGEFPWAVGLINADAGMFWCSASIISKYHVITAAHCVLQSQTQISFSPWGTHLMRVDSLLDLEASFLLGGSTCADPNVMPSVHEVPNSNGHEKPKRLRISKIIVPMDSVRYEDGKNCTWRKLNIYGQEEPFNTIGIHPDIAILELEDPINDINDQIVPICVPSHSTSLPLQYTQYGFGYTDWLSYNNRSCNAQLRKLHLNSGQMVELHYTNSEMLCKKMTVIHSPAGIPCGGDSGGGFSGISNNKHYLFGVIRGANSAKWCDFDRGVPLSVVTNVIPYIDFLCYYTGVCPLGYDVYLDMNYKWHPDGFFLFTREKRSILVDEGSFGFLKRRESKDETLGKGFSGK